MPRPSTSPDLALDLERVVVASVAITASALADVAPELTFIQWRVLVLVDEPAGMAVGAIATALGSKIAAMSRLVGRLRQHGLVETRRGADDARLVFVTLTPRGAELRGRVVERRRGQLARALRDATLAPASGEVVARLATILEAIA